jgi:hypothetical protein
MASFLSFSALIEAISRAVAQAQDQVEKHQVRNLLDYFDSKNRPRSIPFRVKSLRPDAKPGEEDFYSVPLLALISINVLKIKDVQIKFSVDMGELSEEPAPGAAATEPVPSVDHPSAERRMGAAMHPMKNLSVSTATGRSGGKVQVTLRVKGSAPSEGAARLLDYLAQLQGVYPEVIETPETPDGKPPS